MMPKFHGYRIFNFYYLHKCGISFGIHLSQSLIRIDFHILCVIISIGKIPMYQFDSGVHAVSDTYHKNMSKHVKILYQEPTNDIFVKGK